MREKYKVGVIGCGLIFDRHIESIESNSDHFELVALCDTNKKKLDIESKEYNVPGFENHKDMLKEMKGKMSLVVIATPNAYHFEQAMDSLRAGYDILVEKPISFFHKDLKKISDTAKELGRKAYSVLQVRYNPTVNILKRAVEEKILGDIRSVSLVQRWQRPSEYFSTWRADKMIGGRTLFEVGVHYLDIIQILFGVPDVKYTHTFNNKHKNVSFEDTVFSIMQYPNGASGSVEVTIAAEPSNIECSLIMMGSKGFIRVGGRALDKIDEAKFNSKILQDKWNKIIENSNGALEPNSYGAYQGSCPNHPTLYKEIAAGRGIPVSEAINSVKFTENIYNGEVQD